MCDDLRVSLIAKAHQAALDAVDAIDELEKVIGDVRKHRRMAQDAALAAMNLTAMTQQLTAMFVA
jgi:hypothetical protein